MSIRVAGQALRIAAFTGLVLGSASLAGCSTLGMGMGDVTGSTAESATVGGPQAMPAALQPIAPRTQVAEGPYVPPEDISGGSGGLVTGSAPMPSGTIQSSALPPLSGSTPMSAQPQLAPVTAPRTASLTSLPVNNSTPQLAVVSSSGTAAPLSTPPIPANAYTHVIESGESLYTIARRYDVTAQAIVTANGMSSPDKIYVGQRVIIPGRPDLLAQKGPAPAPETKVASIAPISPVEMPRGLTQTLTPDSAKALASAPPKTITMTTTTTTMVSNVAKAPAPVAPVTAPVTTAPVAPVTQVATAAPAPKAPAADPQMSGADKFRWPVSGKVSMDFISSKGTGINIDAPSGTAVRAAENGTVIYVGSGVEGYGNLILIRHPNGYVSAYAHLGTTTVNKGDNVSRGDSIGTVGMTGSVTHPLLHFELRQGATPVDPIPLLAG